MGVNYNVLRDDQMPDDCYPVVRSSGNSFRSTLHLPVIAPPPRKERKHGSKFVFKDTSGRTEDKRTDRQLLVSDYDGSVSRRRARLPPPPRCCCTPPCPRPAAGAPRDEPGGAVPLLGHARLLV